MASGSMSVLSRDCVCDCDCDSDCRRTSASLLARNHSHSRYRQVKSPSWPWVMESPQTRTLTVGAGSEMMTSEVVGDEAEAEAGRTGGTGPGARAPWMTSCGVQVGRCERRRRTRRRRPAGSRVTAGKKDFILLLLLLLLSSSSLFRKSTPILMGWINVFFSHGRAGAGNGNGTSHFRTDGMRHRRFWGRKKSIRFIF